MIVYLLNARSKCNEKRNEHEAYKLNAWWWREMSLLSFIESQRWQMVMFSWQNGITMFYFTSFTAKQALLWTCKIINMKLTEKR